MDTAKINVSMTLTSSSALQDDGRVVPTLQVTDFVLDIPTNSLNFTLHDSVVAKIIHKVQNVYVNGILDDFKDQINKQMPKRINAFLKTFTSNTDQTQLPPDQ